MHLYKTSRGAVLQNKELFYLIKEEWDVLINKTDLYAYLNQLLGHATVLQTEQAQEHLTNYLQAPIGSQEVWAAGVTYLRSRDARMDESKDSGAADCYQKVYEADRPELFFK